MKARGVQEALAKYASDTDAVFLQRFFKTGPGQYGEGDQFIGVRTPMTRLVCRDFKDLALSEIEKLMDSPIHEHRLAAAIIMTEQAKSRRTTKLEKKALFDLYLRRTDRLNNWDIIDVSCRDIVGGYLSDEPRDILYKLARSKNMWERRIAIVSTWQFIREYQLADTLKLAELLMKDEQDLIHKAVGWMLREAGKKDDQALKAFLDLHATVMPRTMLRYSIEKLPLETRSQYMKITLS